MNAQFPDAVTIRSAMALATRAPSVHNSQPWRWRVGDVFFARYWVQAIRYLSRSKLLGKDH